MKTSIIHSPELIESLKNTNLVVDSTAIIDASRNSDFLKFLQELSSVDCVLVATPSVIYEILRFAKTEEKQAELKELLNDLNIQMSNGIEEEALKRDNLPFISAYINSVLGNKNREKGPSFTDSLLCFLLYKYRHTKIKLLTKNYLDIPPAIFDREEIIAYESSNQITTHAIYSLNEKRAERAIEKWKATA